MKIIRKISRVEFWYKDEFYVYECREENNSKFEFIWNDGKRIYGPLVNHSSEEGIEIYNSIKNKLIKL
ncbi:MAG TPA: hypothetical protein P5513_07535 [Candidatus Diapherotrites archaeon]|nr:hypothetical protein [Candidatus Diapherotrites archaeon]